jgi:hypothetical protein
MSGGREAVARLLSSPRRRRRLRTSAVLLALAGALVFVGLHYSNTGRRAPEHFSGGPVQRVPAPLKSAPLSSADQEVVRKVAAHFIDTAVLRRRIDESWGITTAKLHQGLSRRQWDTGSIPVTPFPAGAVQDIKYRVDWTGEGLVYLKVAIVPKATSQVLGQAFDIGLRRRDGGGNHVWLVDYWVPSGVGVPTAAQQAAGGGGEAVVEPGPRIGVGWIFAPVGLLVALILALPLTIFGRHWLHSRRALREYERHRA